MGERSLHRQGDWVDKELAICRDNRKVSRGILEAEQKRVDDAKVALSVAEREWERAKMERDKVLIQIAHCDSRIGDLEAEMRLIDRKLAELRVNDLAERPEPHG